MLALKEWINKWNEWLASPFTALTVSFDGIKCRFSREISYRIPNEALKCHWFSMQEKIIINPFCPPIDWTNHVEKMPYAYTISARPNLLKQKLMHMTSNMILLFGIFDGICAHELEKNRFPLNKNRRKTTVN